MQIAALLPLPEVFIAANNAFPWAVTNTTSVFFSIDSIVGVTGGLFFRFRADFFFLPRRRFVGRHLVSIVVLTPRSNQPSRISILHKPRHHFQLVDGARLSFPPTISGFSVPTVTGIPAFCLSAPKFIKYFNKKSAGRKRGSGFDGKWCCCRCCSLEKKRRSQISQHGVRALSHNNGCCEPMLGSNDGDGDNLSSSVMLSSEKYRIRVCRRQPLLRIPYSWAARNMSFNTVVISADLPGLGRSLGMFVMGAIKTHCAGNPSRPARPLSW